MVDPLAEQLVGWLMTEGNGPAYLRDDPTYAPAVAAWARAEARVLLLSDWLAGKSIEEQLKPPLAGTQPPVETLRRWEQTAAGHRARLGLDPVSRARLQRDLVTSSAIARGSLAGLAEAGRVSVEQASVRGALDGGDGDD